LSNDGNLREFLSTRHVLKEMLKGCSSGTRRKKHSGTWKLGMKKELFCFVMFSPHKDAKAS